MKILRAIFGGRGPKAPSPGAVRPLAAEQSRALQAYPAVPVLDLNVDQLGVKAFFLTPEYAPYGVVNATVDVDHECRPVRNTWRGQVAGKTHDGQLPQGHFLECFRKDLPGGYQRVIGDFGTLDGYPICLVDLVTYPYMFASRHDIHLDAGGVDGPTDFLWKLNHNMLIGLGDLLNRAGPALSFFHTSEVPIEHTPVHNLLIAGDDYALLSTEVRAAYLRSLKASVEDSTIVSANNPIMDDRYCYPRRMSEDGPARKAEIISLPF